MIHIVKIIAGLFIWLILPALINKKAKNKKAVKKFISLSCAVFGFGIIFFGIVDFVINFLNINN